MTRLNGKRSSQAQDIKTILVNLEGTGPLHLGHYVGALVNWRSAQPRPKVARLAKPRHCTPRRQERFLGDILTERHVAGAAVGN